MKDSPVRKPNGPFRVKVHHPSENYTKVPNDFIDSLMHLLKPNEIKLALLFMRSKDDYEFTVTKLAKRFGTSRQNMQNQLKAMRKSRILWNHKDGYELNLNVSKSDLRISKNLKTISRIHGKEKAIVTKKKKLAEKNIDQGALNNNAANIDEINQGALNSIALPALNNNAGKIDEISPRTPTVIETEQNQVSPYKTNTNKTNILDNSIYKDLTISDNSNSIIEGNSLELVLQNSQFKMIYDHSKYDQFDISKFSDSYISHLVIDLKLNEIEPKGMSKEMSGYLFFLVRYSLNSDTPDNNLKKQFMYQLQQINQEDKINLFI
jgi:hypothetical protein